MIIRLHLHCANETNSGKPMDKSNGTNNTGVPSSAKRLNDSIEKWHSFSVCIKAIVEKTDILAEGGRLSDDEVVLDRFKEASMLNSQSATYFIHRLAWVPGELIR